MIINTFSKIINRFITKNLKNILLKTFHTQSFFSIELKVFLLFEPLNSKFVIKRCKDFAISDFGDAPIVDAYEFFKDKRKRWRIGFPEGWSPSKTNYYLTQRLILLVLSSYISNTTPNDNPVIYLPASRSGIMLLYSNYLANENTKLTNNKYDTEIVIEDRFHISDSPIIVQEDNIENEYGLTEPVYNFLMFLLNHKESEIQYSNNYEILEFINNKIIDGKLTKVGNSMRYTPKDSENSIPIFLSSSLVSELAPICQVLSGIQKFDYILYDEIETCQHPTKQIELARLLMRMVNTGYKMIVSTHSCTMAAAINNLITLSAKGNKEELAVKLGYEKEDLINPTNIHAYQFIVSDGRTKVEELPNHFSIGVGFDFTLFNKANEKIYEDAVSLAEEY